jgi:hypothetical protein
MRNNSFRRTFYLGLLVLLILSGLLTIIGINVYKSYSSKMKNSNIEDTFVNVDDDLNKVHDTIYLEKPIFKDTSKIIRVDKVKPIPSNITKKLDTTKSLDTIK